MSIPLRTRTINSILNVEEFFSQAVVRDRVGERERYHITRSGS